MKYRDLKEDQQLLFIELSARLPYGVKAEVFVTKKYGDCLPDVPEKWTGTIFDIGVSNVNTAWVYSEITIYPCGPAQNTCAIGYVTPYLRPMSSMTEDEEREARILWNEDFCDRNSVYHCYPRTMNFYNSRHLDYRNLIGKGLAYEAPADMYELPDLPKPEEIIAV